MKNPTRLPKTPWRKTIKSLGEDKEIEYMLAVDGKHGPSKREVLECLEEKREQFKKFGIDLYAAKLIA